MTIYKYFEVVKPSGDRLFNMMCKEGHEFKANFNRSISQYCDEIGYSGLREIKHVKNFHE